MQTCETCRYWVDGGPRLPDGAPAGWRFCEAASGDGEGPANSATLAFARDYECYKADLVTAPDFGCVMHKRKPPPAQINPPFTAA